MTIVIAGGSGFLGSALVAAWRQDGHRVLVLTRTPREPDHVAWSPDGDTSWYAALKNADVVVNLAGEGIADRRWTDSRKRLLLESRVRATRAMADAVRAMPIPPRVFVNASGVGIYGTRGDEPLDEESDLGSDFLADLCRAWEAEANAAAAVARVVVLRTGIVLDKAGGALPRIARPFRFFAGGPLGSGRQYMPWIHLADWIALVRWATTTDTLSGPLNLTAPAPVTNATFSRVLGSALARPARLPAPAAALRLMLGSEMADALLLGGQRALPLKAQRLGFEFRFTSVDAALRQIYGGAAA